jgi:hypothetical protein
MFSQPEVGIESFLAGKALYALSGVAHLQDLGGEIIGDAKVEGKAARLEKSGSIAFQVIM